MEPLEYVRILFRRKVVVIVVVLVAMFAGLVTAPGRAEGDAGFTATTTLITSPLAPKNFNLSQASVLVTTGDVPKNVAAQLGENLDPKTFTRDLTVVPDTDLGTIKIRYKGANPDRVAHIADLFGQELVKSLDDQASSRFNESVAAQQSRVDQLQAQIAGLEGQVPTVEPKGGFTEAQKQAQQQLDSAHTQYTSALATLSTLQGQGAPVAPLSTLEAAHAVPASSQGFQLPASRPARGILFGLFGLPIGIALALSAERLDNRLRTKALAEKAFGLPIIGEIPPLRGRRSRDQLLTITDPSAPYVEAHRALRTVVLLAATAAQFDRAPSGDADGADAKSGDHHVVLVTSAVAGEGKTTTVAYLAALLAEAGRSVLVVSADLRRPKIHELLEGHRQPGLTDVLPRHADSPTLADLDMRTNTPGVRLLGSGSAVDNPAPFLPATAGVIRSAREVVDFVLVDTPPVLVANDAAELSQAADMVVLVARSGRTTQENAHDAADVLRRLNAPAIGVVLVGSQSSSGRGRYRDRYTESSAGSWWQRLRSRTTARTAEHEDYEPPVRGTRGPEIDVVPAGSAERDLRAFRQELSDEIEHPATVGARPASNGERQVRSSTRTPPGR